MLRFYSEEQQGVEKQLRSLVSAIVEDLMQPEQNGLQPKKED